jgi:hypothetical protein
MGFVIISNKRDIRGVTLFMVDRAKQRASFWSDRLDDVKNFRNYETAKAALSKLHYNNPRIVNYEAAVDLQAKNRSILNEIEMSQAHLEPWDDHKGYTFA